MATELCNLVRHELGANVPMLSLLRGASVDDVANAITTVPLRSRPTAPADTL
jgi:hypothetical protein